MDDEVVITGVGAITPGGNTREATWEALVGGHCAIRDISAYDATGMATTFAGEVRDFKPTTPL